jgi:hypothetical protein
MVQGDREDFAQTLQLPFRARLLQPFDLPARMGSTSIATSTIRRNTTDGSHTLRLA